MAIVMAKTPTCTRCPAIEKLLDGAGIEFQIADISVEKDVQTVLVDVLGRSESPVFLHVSDAPDAEPCVDGAVIDAGTVIEVSSFYDRRLLLKWQDADLAVSSK